MSAVGKVKHPRIPRFGAEAKAKCHREIHGAVVAVSATRSRKPDWWEDNRKRKLQSWSGTLRVIDTPIDGGATAEVVLSVPDTLRHYAEDRLAERDGHKPTSPNGRVALVRQARAA